MKQTNGCSSRYKGVCFKAARGKWLAQIHLNGRQIFLGYHDTELEAAEAYDRAAARRFGESARLNLTGVLHHA